MNESKTSGLFFIIKRKKFTLKGLFIYIFWSYIDSEDESSEFTFLRIADFFEFLRKNEYLCPTTFRFV